MAAPRFIGPAVESGCARGAGRIVVHADPKVATPFRRWFTETSAGPGTLALAA